MSENNVETNPSPSDIYIDGYKLYITYPGLTVTCKYSRETGCMQADL